jgi:hypothetical protein
MPHEEKRDESYKDFADVVRYAAVSRAAEHSLTDSWLEENLWGQAESPYPELATGYGE